MPSRNGYLGGWHAARVVDATYRQLDYWIRTGLLPSPALPAQGKGSRRGFSFLDLIRARTVVRLKSGGASLQAIRRVVHELTQRYRVEDPLTETARLIVADDTVYWITNERQLVEVITGKLAARPLILLDMGEIAQEVKRKVRTLDRRAVA